MPEFYREDLTMKTDAKLQGSTMTTQYRHEAPPHLNGRHQHTYEAIFRHPAAHNLEWHDVRSLLAVLAEVVEGLVHVVRDLVTA